MNPKSYKDKFGYKILVTIRGAARIFLRGRGGGWNYGSKSYEKKKLLGIRIARKAHILWINSWLYSPRNLESFQLNCHLVSLIFFHDDRKTQPSWLHVSAEFCFDLWFFSTVGKHISHVHVFFIFANVVVKINPNIPLTQRQSCTVKRALLWHLGKIWRK